MSRLTQQVFDRTAAAYDEERSRLIPGFDNFYRWAVDLIPLNTQRIVDLGAGTGLLSALVRVRLPEAGLHLIDISEPMLQQARTRLPDRPGITFQEADYCDIALPPQTGAVVSALSIHHLEHTAKRSLFTSIAACLRPGGVFINADQVLGPTPDLEARYRSVWMEQVRVAGASDRQIADSLFRQEADRCATVEEQLGWMREVFVDVDCWFKDGRFAVMSGRRS